MSASVETLLVGLSKNEKGEDYILVARPYKPGMSIPVNMIVGKEAVELFKKLKGEK